MAHTDQFRLQHKEILALATEIGALSLPRVQAGSEQDIKAKMNALAGKLSVHLAMEDRSLYPSMIASQNTAAQRTAQTFKQQMGGIAAAFKAFIAKYPSGRDIADQSLSFSRDFSSISAALKSRISKEEGALYPLADAL